MNQVKIIFFDIDGTLLEMGKTEITPNTRKALCSLKQNGIKICIATAEEIVANGSDKDLEDYFAIAHHRVNVSEKFEEYVDKDVF